MFYIKGKAGTHAVSCHAGVGDMPTGGGGKKEHFLLVDVLGKKPDFMATNWKHHTSTHSFKRRASVYARRLYVKKWVCA